MSLAQAIIRRRRLGRLLFLVGYASSLPNAGNCKLEAYAA
jgi:hypothetical protein